MSVVLMALDCCEAVRVFALEYKMKPFESLIRAHICAVCVGINTSSKIY